MSNLYYLDEYKTFDNVHELNHHVKQHTNKRYYDMNETHRQVLQLLSQYSVKYAGACHLRIQTIADALDKSRRTIERAISVLIELDVIERLNTTRRVSGGKGANIYVIKPYVSEEVASEMSHCNEADNARHDKDKAPIVEKETAYSLSAIKSINKDVLQPLETSHRRPYARFKDAVMTFIGNDNMRLVYRLYGVYLAQSKALRKAYDADELIDIAIRGIHATFFASKRRKIRNIAGYYNGTLSNMFDDMAMRAMGDLWAFGEDAEYVYVASI